MAIKLTYDTVRESFESKGYILLSTEYVNNATKLNYKCPKGHEHSIAWNHWQEDRGCPTCAGNNKPVIEQVKLSFEIDNYILLSNSYINSHTKLDYKCPNGHENSIIWNGWQQGKRCPTCSDTKLTIEHVKESFSEEGYILLSKEYINNATKLDYKCNIGHKHSINWGHWRDGMRCPFCAGNARLNIEHIREYFNKENYTLLSEKYANNHTKLNYICSEGHEHSIRWGNWKEGKRCPTCKNIKFSGSGNPSWKGGISYEPYCPIWSDKEYKQDIRNRDGNKCLNPTCKKKDHRLHIHHINYNKKSCSPSNVITLCGSCNTAANKDREWHTAWYKALMYMRYNYK